MEVLHLKPSDGEGAMAPPTKAIATALAKSEGGSILIEPGVPPAKALAALSSLVADLTPAPVPVPVPTPPPPTPIPVPPPVVVPTPPPVPLGATVYVSSAGLDTNDGASPSRPKKTIKAGMDVLRPGKPDQLLLKRGDTFDEPIRWKTPGLSAKEPVVLSAYGAGEMPLVRTGTAPGLECSGGAGTPPGGVSFVTIRGVRFDAHTRNQSISGYVLGGNNGIRWVHQGSDIVVEDCQFEHYVIGIHFQGYPSPDAWLERVTIKNCLITDSIPPSSNVHSQGVYCERVKSGLVIENNTIDHAGWGDLPVVYDDPTMFNHSLYLQWNNGLDTVVRGNVLSRPASHGLQLRSGGIIEGNFCWKCPIGLQAGYDGQSNLTPPTQPVPGAEFDVFGNVVLEGVDNITAATPLMRGSGWGINFQTLEKATVLNNIVAHVKTTAGNRRSIEDKLGITYSGNIVYDWTSGSSYKVLPTSTGPFKDPNRSVLTYLTSLGLPATEAEFITRIRSRDQRFLAPALISYIRGGFMPS